MKKEAMKMIRGRWYAPVDPACPAIKSYMELADDPMMQMSGCWGDFREDFEKRHRAKCKRCQRYGAANMEARYD